jgi:hypothetical protein
MSAQLLASPDSVHRMEDDRESAFHVLLWIAMRYSSSHVLVQTPSSAAQDTPHTDMRAHIRQFDEAYIDDGGTVRGGSLKRDLFAYKNSLSKLMFDGRPQLGALLKELAAVFTVRYGQPPQPDELEALDIQEALIAENSNSPSLDRLKFIRDSLAAYKYQKIKDHLEKDRHWLVNTIRKHLKTGTWPEDKAESQKIPQVTSKRKAVEDLATLEGRLSKQNSSSKNR